MNDSGIQQMRSFSRCRHSLFVVCGHCLLFFNKQRDCFFLCLGRSYERAPAVMAQFNKSLKKSFDPFIKVKVHIFYISLIYVEAIIHVACSSMA